MPAKRSRWLNVQASYLTSLKHRRLVQIAEETVRERGIIKGQIEALHRQQLKSKLDVDLVQVELTNAESLLVKARNGLKSSFANLNRAMGVMGAEDYVLEDLPIEVRPQRPSTCSSARACPTPNCKQEELTASAEAKITAAKRQYLPTVSAYASGGDFQVYDSSRSQANQTGGWWAAGGFVSMPLFTGFMIENQVREAKAQKAAAEAASMNIEQALTQQVTNSYLDTVSFAQQIKLGGRTGQHVTRGIASGQAAVQAGSWIDRRSNTSGSRANSRTDEIGGSAVRLQDSRGDPCLCLGRHRSTGGRSDYPVDTHPEQIFTPEGWVRAE